MKFDTLHAMIPYVTGGKTKILSMSPYNAITIRTPGRHASQTTPPGGDYVVCVDDETLDWVAHPFTHNDLFNDIANKCSHPEITSFMRCYFDVVVNGKDPEKINTEPFENMEGLHPQTFLYAVQCLAVAEHRRYAQYESKGGGRFLPLRFANGISEGLWSAAQAADKQKRGRPGVEWLEKDYGLPLMTKELLS